MATADSLDPKYWLYLGILMGIALIGGAVVLVIRARLLRDHSSEMSMGFTLRDLRGMHERGELTSEEFAAAHTKMVGRLKGEKKPEPPPEEKQPLEGSS